MHYKTRHIENKILKLFSYCPVVAVLDAGKVGKSTPVERLFHNDIETTVFDPAQDMANA